MKVVETIGNTESQCQHVTFQNQNQCHQPQSIGKREIMCLVESVRLFANLFEVSYLNYPQVRRKTLPVPI